MDCVDKFRGCESSIHRKWKTALCLILLLSPRCSLQFDRFGVGFDGYLGGPLFDHFFFTHLSMLSCACLFILFSPLLSKALHLLRLGLSLPIEENETAPFISICLFLCSFFVHCSLSPLYWLEEWLTSISPHLTPKQNIPSLISVLVFCKVYSGKSEKSEPFPLFYITKTKRSKNSGKTFEENNALFFSPPIDCKFTLCAAVKLCGVTPTHSHSLRYVTNFMGPFFANFSDSLKTFHHS